MRARQHPQTQMHVVFQSNVNRLFVQGEMLLRFFESTDDARAITVIQ